MKTRLEQLRNENSRVKDLSSALAASRWKWIEIAKLANGLWAMVNRVCGFCTLAILQRGTERKEICVYCQTEVREVCDELLVSTAKLEEDFDHLIAPVIEFLANLKFEEG